MLLLIGSLVASRAARLFPNTAGHAVAGRALAFAQKHAPTLTLAAGFAVSLNVTLTSIGAGAVLIPLLYLLYRPDPGRLVGTSIFFGTVLSAAASLLHASQGHVDLRALVALLLGSLPAILLASHLHRRLPRPRDRDGGHQRPDFVALVPAVQADSAFLPTGVARHRSLLHAE